MPGHNENSKGYYTGSVQPEKKGSGMGGVIAGGLGGAAVGALVGHALNDSDSDNGELRAFRKHALSIPFSFDHSFHYPCCRKSKL